MSLHLLTHEPFKSKYVANYKVVASEQFLHAATQVSPDIDLLVPTLVLVHRPKNKPYKIRVVFTCKCSEI